VEPYHIQELSRSELWTENHQKLLKLLQQSTDRKQFQNWTQRNHENFLKSIQQNTDCTHFRTGLKNSRQTLQIFTATYYGLQVFSELDTKIMRNFSIFLQQGTELHAFSEMDSKFMTNFSNVRSEVLIVSIFRTGLKIQ
jgi:hypothetical protein